MKRITGYENYTISENGEVFNSRGAQLKPFVNKGRNEYLRVTLSCRGKSKHFLVHRLVAQEYLRDFNPNLQVDHMDGNSRNNHYSNLQMVTCKENNSLASQREWERGGNQKHSDDVVREAIRLSLNMSTDEVGKLLGISGRQVRRYRSLTSRRFVGEGNVQRLSERSTLEANASGSA